MGIRVAEPSGEEETPGPEQDSWGTGTTDERGAAVVTTGKEIDALLRILVEGTELERVQAADALGEMGGGARDAISALSRARYDDESKAVRAAATRALRKIREQ